MATQAPELVLLRDYPEAMMRALQADYTVHRYFDAADKDALIAAVGDRVRGIVTGSRIPTPRSLIERFPRVEIIACFGVGTDPIDVEYARERGIVVTNTPDALVSDVADMGVALLLAASRQIVKADRFVREGRWLSGIMNFTHRVSGKRAGIVGCGRIGSAVARRLEAFDMTIAYHGPRDKGYPRYGYHADLAVMARAVDFLVLTCPGGPATRHIVDARVLEALGPQGILINIARGSVVDEAALVEALRSGGIRAAGLDVYADEPRAPGALLALDNVVLSPHQSSATHETRAAMGESTLANLRAHFSAQAVPNPV